MGFLEVSREQKIPKKLISILTIYNLSTSKIFNTHINTGFSTRPYSFNHTNLNGYFVLKNC